MTNAQKLEIRASEIRQRLNEISGLEGEALTDEVRTESDTLQTEYRDTETKRRAAIVAESAEDAKVVPVEDLDPETRERLELRSKARVSDFVSAALSPAARSWVPVPSMPTPKGCRVRHAAGTCSTLLRSPRSERAVTPGPADETVANTRPTVPFAFARTDAAALGHFHASCGRMARRTIRR